MLERQGRRGPGLHCESVSWRLPQGWGMSLASCQQGEHELTLKKYDGAVLPAATASVFRYTAQQNPHW